MATLTDAELADRLRELGYNPGPVTATTRLLYIKKLELLKGNDNTHPPRKSDKKETVTRKKVESEKPSTPDRMRRSRGGISLQSTQDSQVFLSTPSNSNRPNVVESTPPSKPKSSNSRHELPVNQLPLRPNLAEKIFKQPLFRSPSTNTPSRGGTPMSSVRNANTDAVDDEARQIGAGHTPTTKTYIYYSDSAQLSDAESDEDVNVSQRSGPTGSSMLSGGLSHVTNWLKSYSGSNSVHQQSANRLTSPSFGRPSSTSASRRSYGQSGAMHVSDSEPSDIESSHKSPYFQQLRSLGDQHREVGTGTSPSLVLTPEPSSVFGTSIRRSRGAATDQSLLSTDGYLSPSGYRVGFTPSDTSSGYHHTGSGWLADAWYRFYANVVLHVPNLILTCGIVVLCALAVGYFVMKDQHGSFGRQADIQKLICNSNVPLDAKNTVDLYHCVLKPDLNDAMPLLSTAFDIASQYSGEYHCESSIGLTSPKLVISALEGLVQQRSDLPADSFGRYWKVVQFLILRVGKTHFGLVAYDSLGKELGSQQHKPSQIYEVLSLQPYFTGMCRLRRLVAWLADLFLTAFWLLLAAGLLVAFVVLVRWVRKRRIEQADKRSNLIREIVLDIIRMLQKQLHENETNSDMAPYIAAKVIRDRMRHRYTEAVSLWTEIVRYVYEVETCIGVQEWRGVGETWQWQGGTGWQGSALSTDSQKAPFHMPPTECLKVRNMFSTEGGLDERAKGRIHRELMTKLAECGPIIHIGLDQVGNKGLVYIKCANPDVAGRVYYAIHANYFDGRLLTVKFLRDAKYCLRFPEARDCHQPLRLVDYE